MQSKALLPKESIVGTTAPSVSNLPQTQWAHTSPLFICQNVSHHSAIVTPPRKVKIKSQQTLVFYTKASAQLVELALTRGLTAATSKQPVRELFTVVREGVMDLERSHLAHCGQEGLGDAAVLCC